MSSRSWPLVGIPSASLEPAPTPGAAFYCFNGNYSAALAASGAAPVAIPLNLPEDAIWAIFERLDGLCLSGGVDVGPTHYGEVPEPGLGRVDAARDDTELKVARWALEKDLPVIGICRGIQLLNVAAGGSLYQDLPSQFSEAHVHDYTPGESPWERPTHSVRIADDSALSQILGTRELAINSFHHQAVKQAAPGFRAVAWAEDGVVEGIEDPERRFALGIQWHPEGMFRTDPGARRIFAAFVEAARKA